MVGLGEELLLFNGLGLDDVMTTRRCGVVGVSYQETRVPNVPRDYNLQAPFSLSSSTFCLSLPTGM